MDSQSSKFQNSAVACSTQACNKQWHAAGHCNALQHANQLAEAKASHWQLCSHLPRQARANLNWSCSVTCATTAHANKLPQHKSFNFYVKGTAWHCCRHRYLGISVTNAGADSSPIAGQCQIIPMHCVAKTAQPMHLRGELIWAKLHHKLLVQLLKLLNYANTPAKQMM